MRRTRPGRVNDGPVWCEKCKQWIPYLAAFEAHRPICKGAGVFVEERSQ